MRIIKALPQKWLSNISPRARILFAMVAIAGAGTLIAVTLLLNLSMSLVATRTDEINVRTSNDIVQAAIKSSIETLTAIATDNSIWGDAAQATYGVRVNPQWAYDNWGSMSKDNAAAYDGSYVMDEHGQVLWGYAHGAPVDGAAETMFGEGFKALVTREKQAFEQGGMAVSGLTRMSDGPAIISIGLIRASGTAATQLGTKRRYLILTRHLSPAVIGSMGKTFHIDGLHVTSLTDSRAPYQNLMDAAGRPVGRLSWTPPRIGAVAATAASQQIGAVTWLVSALVLLFIAISSYGLHKLAKSEQEAQTFALVDGLSRLPNRRALFEHLQQAGKGRGPRLQTVVFIDLDGFKDVNDIYGHNTGDKLIMIVAAALKGFMPEKAMLARMGGDEFALLVAGTDGPALAQTFADATLAFLTTPIRLGEWSVQVGASVGIASGDLGACSSQELFRRADMAMYHSKATGKNRITHYDCALDAVRQRKAAIEKQIREGLARDEFDVVYQPIVDARSQRVTSVEALVRWPGRPEGPLPPDEFIDIAEASGLIHKLGQYVLRKACSDMRGVPDLRLSVNISPAQFRDPDFERKVAEVLKDTGFPVKRLELEVTEGYLIENPERAISAVANLKALGVTLALDDFGTGYSSIGYLRRFQFDRIKIDKSLAGRVDLDPQAAALVAGTVSIANAMGMTVTAEGVESEDHLRLLKLAGCHNLQGFYFSRPRPLAEIVDVLKTQNRATA